MGCEKVLLTEFSEATHQVTLSLLRKGKIRAMETFPKHEQLRKLVNDFAENNIPLFGL